MVNAAGGDVYPVTNIGQNFGTASNMWSAGYFREIRALTLVAQDVVSTIGGWLYVGATTKLLADAASGAGRVVVEHNQAAVGDRFYLSARLQAEVMVVTVGPVACSIDPAACGGIGTGYYYDVTRGDAGTGADNWIAGDAAMNTGVIGDCFIEQYAFTSLGSGSAVGPSIVGNCRTANSGYAWAPRWAIGQLNGLYGIATSTFGVGLGDPAAANSIIAAGDWRLRQGTTDVIVLDGATGDVTLTGDLLLSTGGTVTSTGSFTLTPTAGLLFSDSSNDTDYPRMVRWAGGSFLRGVGTSLVMTTGVGSGGRLGSLVMQGSPSTGGEVAFTSHNGTSSSQASFQAHSSGASTLLAGNILPSTGSALVDGTATLGNYLARYDNINLALDPNAAPAFVIVNKGGGGSDEFSALGYIAGVSKTVTIGCGTLIFTGGVLTGGTCP